MTVRSIKICHSESDSALRASGVHFAEGAGRQEPGSQGEQRQPAEEDRFLPLDSLSFSLRETETETERSGGRTDRLIGFWRLVKSKFCSVGDGLETQGGAAVRT